jgi:hypothetical protein
MGLKGYRLWVMGQLDSNAQSPTSDSTSSPNARVTSKEACLAYMRFRSAL